MTENTSPAAAGSAENTAVIKFGDSDYTITRLKAGKFYSALKVYMDIIKDMAPKTQEDKDKNIVPLDQMVTTMFQTWPDKMIEFISICTSTVVGLDRKKIAEEAYPEQVTEAFRVCLKLNRVAENLKNFAAPIGELGGEIQPATKQ